jgi:hypothetical protein
MFIFCRRRIYRCIIFSRGIRSSILHIWLKINTFFSEPGVLTYFSAFNVSAAVCPKNPNKSGWFTVRKFMHVNWRTMSVPMDAVQLDLAGSDRSVVFVHVRTNPTSQVFACFHIHWTRALSSQVPSTFFLERESIMSLLVSIAMDWSWWDWFTYRGIEQVSQEVLSLNLVWDIILPDWSFHGSP